VLPAVRGGGWATGDCRLYGPAHSLREPTLSQPAPLPPSPAPGGAAAAPLQAVPSAADALPEVPLDLTAPQLTVRAIVAGMVIGGALALCNIYAGLKVGWGFNMSITAALIGFGVFSAGTALFRTRPFGILECNINQTSASAAAYVSSAGLVSAIPALTLVTGQELSWPMLSLWSFSVCVVGVVVAVGLRRQMLLVDKLPFASGIAAAQTLKEMYARGAEAMGRVRALLGAAAVASAVKLAETIFKIPKLALPGAVPLKGAEGVAAVPAAASLKNLTFALDPALMMVAVGAIVGMRASASLLLGAVIGWGFITPYAISQGWAQTGAPDAPWFSGVVTWLLWPGVAMMVTSSLTSFAFSWRSMLNAFKSKAGAAGPAVDAGEVSRTWFWRGLVAVLLLSVLLQVVLFGISAHIAVIGVLLTFALAVVAGRVAGETAITPVGPMGKVTQLVFGILAPASPAANLMAANVTGGAASQCGDLLHDLKAGYLLGAKARLQALAQLFGIIAGALVGSAAYLIIIPNPKEQLLTAEWPAPAVAQWKAVAEVFAKGFDSMPGGAVGAMIIAGGLGLVLAVGEKLLPKNVATWIPSPSAMGLALVIPAWNSISFFIGAAAALVAAKLFKSWAARFVVVIASGIIAGEGLTGVGIALQKILFP
jgi:putative OPT family oligopeptide transporter